MKTLSRLALFASLIAFGTTSLEAAPVPTDGVGPAAVHIVNNYSATVQVYAEDAAGRLHKLGRVSRGKVVEFEVPAEITADVYRIKVYPHQPVWASQYDDFGIKTNPLYEAGDTDLTLWLEPDLRQSTVEMKRR